MRSTNRRLSLALFLAGLGVTTLAGTPACGDGSDEPPPATGKPTTPATGNLVLKGKAR
jgi:hypothetical protein